MTPIKLFKGLKKGSFFIVLNLLSKKIVVKITTIFTNFYCLIHISYVFPCTTVVPV